VLPARRAVPVQREQLLIWEIVCRRAGRLMSQGQSSAAPFRVLAPIRQRSVAPAGGRGRRGQGRVDTEDLISASQFEDAADAAAAGGHPKT
jgi:hypothetical protein